MRWMLWVFLIYLVAPPVSAESLDRWSIYDPDLRDWVLESDPDYLPWPNPPSDLQDWVGRSQYYGYGDYLHQRRDPRACYQTWSGQVVCE